MNSTIIAVMIGVSVFLGLSSLIAFLWGLKGGQFDDETKFRHGAMYDGEDELNEAYQKELRAKESRDSKAS